jgi:hypothetical protein
MIGTIDFELWMMMRIKKGSWTMALTMQMRVLVLPRANFPNGSYKLTANDQKSGEKVRRVLDEKVRG